MYLSIFEPGLNLIWLHYSGIFKSPRFGDFQITKDFTTFAWSPLYHLFIYQHFSFILKHISNPHADECLIWNSSSTTFWASDLWQVHSIIVPPVVCSIKGRQHDVRKLPSTIAITIIIGNTTMFSCGKNSWSIVTTQ